MSWLARLVDMIAGKAPPPYDERSRNADLLAQQENEAADVRAASMASIRRADRLAGELDSYRRIAPLHRR